MSFSALPTELIAQILKCARPPFAILQKLQLVCKRWQSVIAGMIYSTSHLPNWGNIPPTDLYYFKKSERIWVHNLLYKGAYRYANDACKTGRIVYLHDWAKYTPVSDILLDQPVTTANCNYRVEVKLDMIDGGGTTDIGTFEDSSVVTLKSIYQRLHSHVKSHSLEYLELDHMHWLWSPKQPQQHFLAPRILVVGEKISIVYRISCKNRTLTVKRIGRNRGNLNSLYPDPYLVDWYEFDRAAYTKSVSLLKKVTI